MHFLLAAGMLMVALFIGSFFISGITTSFKEISSFPRNYGYPHSQDQLGGASAGVPQVAGASTANPLYAGEDIESLLRALPNAKRFNTLFTEVGGASFLTRPTLYTLFVPTDEAFAKLPYPAQVTLNTMTYEEKVRFVTYHLVPQKMVAVGGQRAGVVTTISRDVLNFELTDTGGTVGNASVVYFENAEDGIVYILDSVLLPPNRRVELQSF